MKRLLPLLAAVAVSGLTVQSAAAQEKLKIGILTTLSGPAAARSN